MKVWNHAGYQMNHSGFWAYGTERSEKVWDGIYVFLRLLTTELEVLESLLMQRFVLDTALVHWAFDQIEPFQLMSSRLWFLVNQTPPYSQLS